MEENVAMAIAWFCWLMLSGSSETSMGIMVIYNATLRRGNKKFNFPSNRLTQTTCRVYPKITLSRRRSAAELHKSDTFIQLIQPSTFLT